MAEEQVAPKRPEKASVLARLEALGGDKKRPQTALLAEHLEGIEQAIQRGIPVVSVWKALQEEGFTLTFKSFENALHRLRKRKAGSLTNKPPKTKAQPSVPAVTPSKAQETPEVQTEEDKEFEAYKKSVAHLPIIQRSKKIADFLEKQQENKMSPSTRKWLGEK